jgi:hypothetical protein
MKYLGFLIILLFSCANPQPTDPFLEPGSVLPEVEQCMRREAVRQYLADVEERVMEAWELPAGVAPNQKIKVIFSIRESGQLGGYLVPDAHRQDIEESALAAIQAAAPFPPLSRATACLSVIPIGLTFSNPLSQ